MARKNPIPTPTPSEPQTDTFAALPDSATPTTSHLDSLESQDIINAAQQHAEGDGVQKQAVPATADGIEREVVLNNPREAELAELLAGATSRGDRLEDQNKQLRGEIEALTARVKERDESDAKAQAEAQRLLDAAVAQEEAERVAQEAARSAPLPDVVQLANGQTLTATKVGLPNTCSITGVLQTERWFAVSTEAARAGQGICEEAVRELMPNPCDARS